MGKKRTSLLALKLVFAVICIAQQSENSIQDSLQNRIQVLENTNSVKEKIELSNVYFELGELFKKQRDADSAIKNYNSSIAILELLISNRGESSELLELLADCYNNRATVEHETVNYRVALKSYEKSMDIGKQLEDTMRQVKAHLNMSMLLKRQGNYQEAINGYYNALRLFEKLNDSKGIAICYLSIANVQRVTDELEKAVINYKKAKKKFLELDDTYGVSACNNNLAISFKVLGNYMEAVNYYKKVEDYELKEGDKYSLGRLYGNLGIAMDSVDRKQSFQYHLKGYDIATQVKDSQGLVTASISLAYWYLHEYNLSKRKNYLKKSIFYAQNALGAEAINFSPVKKMSAMDVLLKAEQEMGNFEVALKLYKQKTMLNDSLFSAEKAEAIADIETKYETEKKEEQLKQQKAQISSQEIILQKEKLLRNVFIISAMVLLLLSIIIFRNLQQKRRDNKLLAAQKKEIEHINAKLLELDRFKETMTGMIVHDLKNPLNSILGVSESKKIRAKVMHILQLVSNLLDIQKFEDSSMNITPQKTVLLQSVNHAIDQLSNTITEKNIAIENNISNDMLILADESIIERIFVNLLSNAVKFTPNNGRVSIIAKEEADNLLKINIKDEGVGIPKDKQSKIFEKFEQLEAKNIGITSSTGLGLTFCKLAVEAHNGKIGVDSDGENGSVFWFSLKKLEGSPENNPAVITEINTDSSAYFNEIEPYALRLREMEFYEISKIREYVNSIECEGDERITSWKNAVLNAVTVGNENLYIRLISNDE